MITAVRAVTEPVIEAVVSEVVGEITGPGHQIESAGVVVSMVSIDTKARTRFFFMLKRIASMLKTRGTRREGAKPVKVEANGMATEAEEVWNAVIVIECETLAWFVIVEVRVVVSETLELDAVMASVSDRAGPGAVTKMVVVVLLGATAETVLKLVAIAMESVSLPEAKAGIIVWKTVVVDIEVLTLP